MPPHVRRGRPTPTTSTTRAIVAAEQRRRLPGSGQPAGSVPERDRRARVERRDHGGHDGAASTTRTAGSARSSRTATADPTAPTCSPTPGNVPESAIDPGQGQRSTTRNRRPTPTPTDPQAMANAQQRAGHPHDAAGAGGGAQARAHLRRAHAARQQALREELAGARLVHLLAPDRQLRGPLPGRAELLRAERQQRLRHARSLPQPERPAAQRPPAHVHLDGYYTHAGRARGRSRSACPFSARSGMPRNYVSDLYAGQQLVDLLPRGSAGRTPTVTQFDGKIAYGRALTDKVNARGVHRPLQRLQPAGGDADRRQLHLRRGGADRQRHHVGSEVREEHLRAAAQQEPELRAGAGVSGAVQRPPGPAPHVLARGAADGRPPRAPLRAQRRRRFGEAEPSDTWTRAVAPSGALIA